MLPDKAEEEKCQIFQELQASEEASVNFQQYEFSSVPFSVTGCRSPPNQYTGVYITHYFLKGLASYLSSTHFES